MNHKLSQITIQNYKSIISHEFDLTDYTPLIGYNNAGKSNLLSGIKWLLRKSSLSVESFNSPNDPVTIEGKIEGIDDALLGSLTAPHKASIKPYIDNGELRIKRVQNQPGDTVTNIKLFVYDSREDAEENPWVANPNGIDGAISALFPESIHIGAMENSEEDVSKPKTTSTIGKLLSEIIGPIETQYGAQVTAALNSLKDILDAEGLNRAPELTQFDTEVNQKIDNFFPDVNIRLHVPTPELKEVFNKGTIKVYESHSPNGRDVSALGHGAQRSIQMALIRHLAELKRASQTHNTTTLLLIDEPELYLHPHAIEIVRDALKMLSTQGYQVIFSTHSAMMVTQADMANAILIRKDNAQGTHKKLTLKHAVSQIAQDAPSQIQLIYSLSNSSKILFSERVILTEGKTEQRILPKIIEKITGKTLGLHKYALIRQDGVTNTKKSLAVLDVMGLPSKAIVDLDYAFKNATTDGFLAANDPDVTACHQFLAQIAVSNGIDLGNDGWPKTNTRYTAAEAVAFLASHAQIYLNIESLHVKLLAHNIWVWKKGAIEKHIGITGKSEQVWSNFVTQMQTQSLQDIVPDYPGVEECIVWLTD
ncbi:MAG: AAA family ATPase [Leadbetterella sp.]|nr:AAA family ATPase [Leadbetterella sp.]